MVGDVSINVYSNAITKWDDSEIKFLSPEGEGVAKLVRVTNEFQQTRFPSLEVSEFLYSYDSPTISSVNPSSGPTNGGNDIVLTGASFGTQNAVLSATINGVTAVVGAHTHSEVTITVPAGEDVSNAVELTVESQVSNTDKFYDYNPPAITSISDPVSGVGKAGATLELSGTSFGLPGNGLTVTIGGSTCEVTFHTHGTVRCTIPSGQGSGQLVELSIGVRRTTTTFSYAAPEVTGIDPTSGDTDGTYDLTISGTDFGSVNPTVNLGPSVCTVTGRTMSGGVIVTVPAGQGRNLPVTVSAGQQASNSDVLFDYNPPRNILVNPATGPAVGNVQIVLTGASFGQAGSVTIGGEQVPTTSLYTDGRIEFNLPPGVGSNLDLVVEASGQFGSAKFSYDPPTVTQIAIDGVVGATGVTEGSVSGARVTLTITGSNFGLSPAVVSIGTQTCVASSDFVQTDGLIHCELPAGQGKNLAVKVTAGGQDNLFLSEPKFSYTPPVINSVAPVTGPTEGGGNIVLTGSSLGTSGTVKIGTRTCTSSAGAHTHTRITCQLPAGQGSNLQVSADVSGQTGVASQTFTYNNPSIALVAPPRGPTSGTTNVELTGSSFGSATGTIAIGTFSVPLAKILSWTSTKIVFTVPVGAGAGLPIVVTASDGKASPGVRTFSYDRPSISNPTPAQRPTGGGVITLTGTSMGVQGQGSITVGGVDCPIVAGSHSHTSVQCTVPAGNGVSKAIVMRVVGQDSVSSSIFSYAAPFINTVTVPGSGNPTGGGAAITIAGTSLGLTGSGTATVNGDTCTITSHSHNQIICSMPAGVGTNLDVRVNIGSQPSNTRAVSYSPPTITSVDPRVDLDTSGGDALVIVGTNFGSAATANRVTVRLGGRLCTNLAVSEFRIDATAPEGEGISNSLQVIVAGQSAAFAGVQYGDPIITNVISSTGLFPTGGNVDITVTGSNFGLSGSVTVNAVSCPVSTRAHDEIVCKLPAGSGSNVDVVVNVVTQSSDPYQISYDGPTISTINPTTSDTAGGATLTLVGKNFGSTGVVTVGDATCPPVGAGYGDQLIECKLPAGQGASASVVVEVDGQGSNTDKFVAYNRPTLSTLLPPVGATGGGYALQIDGDNLGTSGSVTIDGNTCNVVSHGHKQIVCTVPAGNGEGLAVTVDISGQTPAADLTFSYARPVISKITPGSSSTEGVTVVIEGTSLDAVPGSVAITTQGTDKDASVQGAWDHSSVFVAIPAGEGVGNPVVLTTVSGFDSNTLTFDYDKPVLDSIEPTSAPTGGVVTTLTLTGSSFSITGGSASVEVGNQDCAITFNTHDTIECTLPNGRGTSKQVIVTVGGQSSNLKLFSYEDPVLTSLSTPMNLNPTEGLVTLTIEGTSLATGGGLVTVGSKTCTNLFQNHTQITCTLPEGEGVNRDVRFTIDGSQPSNTLLFSYDPPTLSTITPSAGPTRGDNTIVIVGDNFGTATGGALVSVGGLTCTIVPPILHQQISCKVPAGEDVNKEVRVQVAGQMSSTPQFYSYDRPSITLVNEDFDTTAGGSVIEITGTSFGTTGFATIGNKLCVTQGEVDHDKISCRVPVGQGRGLDVVVNVGSQSSDPASFDYLKPVIESVIPASGPTVGGIEVVVTGESLGTSGVLTIGTTPCQILAGTHTHTSIKCVLGEGQGLDLPVVATISQQVNDPSANAEFSFDAPEIFTLDPPSGPTDGGGQALTITGVNFGLSGSVKVGVTDCPITGAGYRQSRIECQLPAGVGVVGVVVTAGGQPSPSEEFRYDAPVLTSLDPPSAASDGLATLTIQGSNFGAAAVTDIQVTVGPTECSDVAHNHTYLTCNLPAGVGTELPVSVVVASQSGDNTLPFSYDGPSITSVEGCVDNGVKTESCDVNGNTLITITGTSFGPSNAQVTVDGNDCTDVTHDSVTPHAKLTCRTPTGKGFEVAVRVTQGGTTSSASANLLSYTGPVITPGTLKVAMAMDVGNVTLSDTDGGQELEITGQFFSDDLNDVTVTYGLPGDPTLYTCDVTSSTTTSIVCTVPAGVGKDMVIVVSIDSGLMGVGIQTSEPSTDLLSYPRPVITPAGSLRNPPNAGVTDLVTTSSEGVIVQFEATNLGVDASLLEVYYGEVGTAIDDKEYQCINVALVDADTIQCRTVPGTGSDLVFQIVALNNPSDEGSDKYNYPDSPTVERVEGCSNDGVATKDCPTAGGNVLDIFGTNFAQSNMAVKIGVFDCGSFKYVSNTNVQCTLPVGVGSNLPVVAVVGQLFSRGAELLSYAAPTLDNVEGCPINEFPTTKDCARDGSGTPLRRLLAPVVVTISGANFGESGAIVLVGGKQAVAVDHDATNPHSTLYVTLPSGEGLDRAVLVIQGGGGPSVNILQLSYEQCPAGKREDENSLGCIECDPGFFTDAAGLAACKPCEAGQATNSSGSTSCTKCLPGSFAAGLGSTECSPCDPGSFSATSGQETVCDLCPAGSFALNEGAQECDLCETGRASLSLGATDCTDCDAGRFAAVEGSLECVNCPSGRFSGSIANVCTPCLAGQFQENVRQSRCEDCLPGSISDVGGQAQCTQCESGRFSNDTGLTVCTPCTKGSVSLAVNGIGPTECTKCPKGSFIGVDGQATCLLCPKGTYSDTQGATSCTPCASGRFSDQLGATDCVDCVKGEYSASILGSVQCIDCALGRYSDIDRASNCEFCEPGRYQNQQGQQDCLNCTAGSAMKFAGQASCAACPSGTYSDQEMAVDCLACDPGRFSLRVAGSTTGPTVCTDCPQGSFNNAPGQQDCRACPLGRYATTLAAATECAACEAGTFAGTVASTSCANCTAGEFSAGGAFVCTQCPAGRFGAEEGASTCEVCEAGSAQNTPGSSACTNCTAGFFSPAEELSTCLVCPAGQFSNGTAAQGCFLCDEGYFQNEPGKDSCIPCAAGFFTDNEGQASCTECPRGRYSEGLANSECLACPVGTYGERAGVDACRNCTAGSYAPSTGSLECVPCQLGRFVADEAATDCEPCDPGFYQPQTGQDECLPCPVRTFTSTQGQSACLACPAGRFSAQLNTTLCEACAPGTFNADSGALECTNCTAGSISSTEGSLSCSKCQPGFIARIGGLSECTACDKGTFQSAAGATQCTDCPAGKSQNSEGQVQCQTCTAGRFTEGLSVGNINCDPCDAGTFASGTGNTACTNCTAGTFVAISGQSECDPCEPGSYQPDEGQVRCLDCPAGTEQPSGGTTECTNCTAGYFAPVARSVACLACGVGEFSDSEAAVTCQVCPEGSRQPGIAQSSCVDCDDGSVTNKPGQGVCLICPAGKFGNSSDLTTCIECKEGRFQELPGQTQCVDCPAGKITSATGQAQCVSCAAGSFSPDAGQDACTPCGVGKFSSLPAATECTNCTAGRFSDIEGSLKCQPCALGSATNLVGQTQCTLCDPGTFSGTAGASVCAPCDAGKFALNSGQSLCLPCAAGEFAAGTGSDSCTQCVAGRFQASSGASDCVDCEAGRFAAQNGSLTCDKCDVGSYAPGRASQSCIKCDAGTVQSAQGASECLECDLGTFRAEEGQSFCPNCNPGTFANETASVECTECAPGKYSVLVAGAGASGCRLCELGRFQSNSGQDGCVECPSGRFADVQGLTVCKPCKEGFFASGSGASTCTACQLGRFAPKAAASTCLACGIGRFAGKLNTTLCDLCPGGRVQPLAAQAKCDRCPVGTFQAVQGQATCLPCGVGTYGNAEELTVCVECELGRYNDESFAFGSLGLRDCKLCEPGKFADFPKSITCKNCPLGKFSNGTEFSECLDCPAGKIQALSGQTGCVDCTEGKFTDVGGQFRCKACPAGTFTDVNGTTECPDCPRGRVNPLTGQSGCEPCPLGQFPFSTTDCAECTPGRFGSLVNTGDCDPCVIGQFSDVFGGLNCSDCAVGRFAATEGLSRCTLCEAGKYGNETGQGSCVDCPAGKFSSSLGSTECTDCPIGSYADTLGQQSCNPCQPGSFGSRTGQSVCDECPPGRFGAVSNATDCEDCQVGRFAETSAQLECTECPTRTFGNVTALQECTDCPAGTYQNVTGSTECSPCEPGTASTQPAQEQCNLCPAGTFSLLGGLCELCPRGRFEPLLGSTECSPCPKRTAASKLGSTFCSVCAPGRFGNETGLEECKICNAGTASEGNVESCFECTPGRTSQAEASRCVDCAPGRFGGDFAQSLCDPCPAGRSQPDRGQAGCIACAVGRFTSQEAQDVCQPCGTGKFMNGTGAEQCDPCRPGTKQSGTGSTECEPCERGKHQELLGTVQCELCDSGTFMNNTGAIQCDEAQPGSYVDSVGQFEPTLCEPGLYSANPRQQRCALCEPGRFNNDTGQTGCEACGAGLYQPNAGQNDCDPCPAGQFSIDEGSISCALCTPGKFSSGTNATVCSDCPAGRFQSLFGQVECKPCLEGTYTNEPGAARCVACEVGSFNVGSNNTACEKCPPGTFVSSRGSNRCFECPPGSRSGEGQENCAQCSEGTVAPGVGSQNCTSCDVLSVSNADNTFCICDSNYYADSTLNNRCIECPLGMDCSTPGSTDQDVVTSPDYFREAGTLNFFRCQYGGQCRDGGCAQYRSGPLCANCDKNFHAYFGGSCKKCPGRGGSIVYLAFIIIVSIALYSAICYALLTQTKVQLRQEQAWMADELLHDGDEVAILNDKEKQPELFGATYDPSVALLKNGKPKHPPTMVYKIKIIIGFMQILTNVGINLNIPWPNAFKAFVSFFSVANFDVVQASNLECVTDQGMLFYYKFILMCLLPLIMIGFIVLLYYLPKRVLLSMSSKTISRPVGPNQIITKLSLVQTKALRAKALRRKVMKLILFALFLIYPVVASTVLRVFACRTIEGTTWLAADFNAKCYDERWTSYSRAAYLFVAAYAVGIPFFMYIILRRNHHQLRRPGVLAELGFLYDGYEGNMWWFEMVDMLHKLVLVALCTFMPVKYQLPTAMGVVAVYTAIIMLADPYKRAGDDTLHTLVNFALFLFIYAGYVLYIRGPFEEDWKDGAMSTLLIVLTLMLVSYALYQGVLLVLFKFKRWRAYREKMRQENDDGIYADDLVAASRLSAEAKAKAKEKPVFAKEATSDHAYTGATGQANAKTFASQQDQTGLTLPRSPDKALKRTKPRYTPARAPRDSVVMERTIPMEINPMRESASEDKLKKKKQKKKKAPTNDMMRIEEAGEDAPAFEEEDAEEAPVFDEADAEDAPEFDEADLAEEEAEEEAPAFDDDDEGDDDELPLDDGWTEHVDDQGRQYWWHEESDESSWVRPGWEKKTDENGTPFFWHNLSEETSWTNPTL